MFKPRLDASWLWLWLPWLGQGQDPTTQSYLQPH